MTPTLSAQTTATKAFGYLRVSSEGQLDGEGLTRQRTAIESYAAAHGITIVKIFEEKGVSGTLANRPAWHELMEALLSNGTKTVIVERMDRLARDFMVQETLVADLRKRDFNFISTAEPDLCSDDPSRKFIRKLLGLVAEYDRDMLVAKLKGARERKRDKTGRCEGRKPFGYYPGESETAARILTLYASLHNYEHVAKALNAEGFQTRGTKKRKGEWCAAGVRRIVLQAGTTIQKEAA